MTKLTPFRSIHDLAYNNGFFNPFPSFFNTPTITRELQIPAEVLADKENYSIYELSNGKFEVRVQYADDASVYHQASIKASLDDAKLYVEKNLEYFQRKLEGPKKVWDGKESE